MSTSASPGTPTDPRTPDSGEGGAPPVDGRAGAAAGVVEYHRIHRLGAWGRHGWWRGLVGSIAAVVGVFIVMPVVLLLAFMAWFWATGAPVSDGVVALIDTNDVTPTSLAFLNLTLAAAIPVIWFVTLFLHGLRPRWVASVMPRLRWRWFVVALGLSVLALMATLVVSALLPTTAADGVAVTGRLNDFTATTRDFVLVVLLLTPLQAAGEEYLFRGYLTQALGGLVRSPRLGLAVAVLVPAVLFALAHGAQDPPVFVDRLAFGIVAGVLTIATGGLEAAIAMHVLNNFLAFGLALAFGDMTSALNPTGGTWWSLPTTLTQSVVYTALAIVVARRTGVATRTTHGPSSTWPWRRAQVPGRPEGVLEGSDPRV